MADEPEPRDVGPVTATDLATIADALAEASRQVWAGAADDPSPADLESFAIGIQIAQARVCALLPADWKSDGSAAPGIADASTTAHRVRDRPASVIQLLIEAERILRILDFTHVDLILDPGLTVELGELLREAQHVWR